MDVIANGIGKFLPSVPVIFVAPVFDRANGELVNEFGVEGNYLVRVPFRTVAFTENVFPFLFVEESEEATSRAN